MNNNCMKSILIVTLLFTLASSLEINIQDLLKGNSSYSSSQIKKDGNFSNNGSLYNSSSSLNLLDIQIDEKTYRLGSGDKVSIHLWGIVNRVIDAKVNLEGSIIIPDIGEVNVNDKTLFEGKQLLKEKILEIYKNVDLTIVLSSIREFKVYLLGDIPFSGDYSANGASRVSDVLSIIKSKTLSEKSSDFKVDMLRNVVISNDKLGSRTADMSLFFHSNNVDNNPYLFEGDRIFIGKPSDIISINGAVNYPGSYEYKNGDSLGIILQVVGGMSRGADSTKIMVTRFYNDTDSLRIIELNLMDQSVLGFKLEKDDRILVKSVPDYRIHRQIRISGEVKYPGIYPIQKDKTKLFEIFQMAGGLTDQAFLKGSKMIRRKHTNVGDKEFERILKLPPESLSPLEKSYLKTRLTEEDKRVNIDFEELLNYGDDINNIVLRDGDEITIAHKNLSVKMTGAVINPGLIEFKKDENINYYIKRAGGFNSRAKKRSILIMKAGTEVWLEPKETEELEPGDAIWVPDKGYRNGYSIAKEIIIVLGSVAALVISAFTIHDFLTND